MSFQFSSRAWTKERSGPWKAAAIQKTVRNVSGRAWAWPRGVSVLVKSSTLLPAGVYQHVIDADGENPLENSRTRTFSVRQWCQRS